MQSMQSMPTRHVLQNRAREETRGGQQTMADGWHASVWGTLSTCVTQRLQCITQSLEISLKVSLLTTYYLLLTTYYLLLTTYYLLLPT